MSPALRRNREFNGRNGVRRAVVMMPNGLTLANLLCGIYAIILSFRGEFASAPGFIVLGGIADMLDGRVARATGTGSRFGEELDSLVDAISFGFAPALMVYLGLPNRGNWEWLFIFFFTSCAVMRLARFNVEQAGRKKTHFHGLPSPAAGLTLATYYWFAQTPLYNQAVILFTDSKTLATFPWHIILLGLMASLAALMISDVPYPAVPSIGFKNIRQILATLMVAVSIVLLLTRREEFLFPALLAYVLYGVVKWLLIGFLGRSSTPDEIYWEREAELHQSHEPRSISGLASVHEDMDLDEAMDEDGEPRRHREAHGLRSSRESREERGGREGRERREGRESSRESRREAQRDTPREARREGKREKNRDSKRDAQRDERREAKREAQREAQRDAQREAQRAAQKETQREERTEFRQPLTPVDAELRQTSIDAPLDAGFPADPDAPDTAESSAASHNGDEGAAAPTRKRRRRRGGRGNRARNNAANAAANSESHGESNNDVDDSDGGDDSREPHESHGSSHSREPRGERESHESPDTHDAGPSEREPRGVTPPGPTLPDTPTGSAE